MCIRDSPYVVAVREEFLTEPKVRGTICFFRFLSDPEDESARKLSLKLLWGLSSDCISDAVFESMKEKYLPKMKKEKPQKVMESVMKDMALEGEEAMEKLASKMCIRDRAL